MPKIQISICPWCKTKTCDGSVWKMISAIPTISAEQGKEIIEKIPAENKIDCGIKVFGRKIPKGPIGTNAKEFHSNWINKCNVVWEKIEL